MRSSYEDCGSSSDPLVLSGISVVPDQILFPGDLAVQGTVSVKKNFDGPIKGR